MPHKQIAKNYPQRSPSKQIGQKMDCQAENQPAITALILFSSDSGSVYPAPVVRVFFTLSFRVCRPNFHDTASYFSYHRSVSRTADKMQLQSPLAYLGSEVSSTPSFWKVFSSVSLSIREVWTWLPRRCGSCFRARSATSLLSELADRAISTSSM